ncbi:hypothetical protein ABVK25_008644 [Lepraria finkii]|uniref:DUF7708 domain-containing protein n=1 Tax=Lepraria finkii TaxID=1340010 RepID=A0ABR4AZH4_9LECA
MKTVQAPLSPSKTDSRPHPHVCFFWKLNVAAALAAQIAEVAQNESISKCLEAFGEEARDMATGNFKAASVLELAKAKREEKAPAEGSKTDKVLKWAVSFANIVDAYSKVLDVYISKAPEVAGLVWGGCKILLQTGLNYIEVLEKPFAILNSVGENIGQFQQCEALFKDSEHMKHALAFDLC